MRKLIVMIECDSCRLPFNQVAFTADAMDWLVIADDLEYSAQQAGWHCYNGRHDCFECLLEVLYPEEFRAV